MLKVFAPTDQLASAKTNSVTPLPSSLRTLIRYLGQAQTYSLSQIKNYVERASVSAADLMPWADFSHPVTDSYGRKLVFHGGYFEVMVMSWAPGDYSAIHDHGGAQWGAVQCFGAADHYVYRHKHGRLTTLKPAHYTPGMIHTVDNGLIHQMGNPGSSPLLSLHVYGCMNYRQAITGGARIFNLFENSTQYTDGGVFFCLPDAQITRRQHGLQGDVETTLRHHRQMRDRLVRILDRHSFPHLAEKLTRLNHEISRLAS